MPTAPDYRGRRTCVTGGAGFIGSHLVDALLTAGAAVTVIDDLSTGQEENLPDGVAWRNASILDASALDDAVAGTDVVFHLAAMPSIPRSVRDPVRSVAVNAMGTQRVLDAARRKGCGRVVFAASSSAYGDQPGLPRIETMPPDVRSPYAAAKCTAEYLVRAYAACYPLDTVSLRYFNIFGPRQRADSPYAAVIPKFAAALRAGEPAVIFGDGTQTRDFTFVANAVHANLLAGATDRRLDGVTINVATGTRRSVIEVLEAVAKAIGLPPSRRHEPPRTGEVQHSLASLERAKALLGYEPIVSFEEGLRRAVEQLSS